MRTKRMAVVVLMLGMVVLFSGVKATVNSADAVSPGPVIKVSGSAKCTAWQSFFGGSAKSNSQLGASTWGLANMYAAAKNACPKGYRIVSVPVESMSTSCVWGTGWWTGWVAYTSVYHVSMEIECEDGAGFPEWRGAFATLTPEIEEQFKKEVAARYERLKQIKTPDQLISLVESSKERGVDYSPFERAKRNGQITRVALPSLEELSTIHIEGRPRNR